MASLKEMRVLRIGALTKEEKVGVFDRNNSVLQTAVPQDLRPLGKLVVSLIK